MDAISRLLVTYLVNALWQIPAILVMAALCARLMRRAPSLTSALSNALTKLPVFPRAPIHHRAQPNALHFARIRR